MCRGEHRRSPAACSLELQLNNIPLTLNRGHGRGGFKRSRHAPVSSRGSVGVRTDLRGAAKVDEGPGVVLRPPEDVAGLEVAMRDSGVVERLHPLADVAQHLHSIARSMRTALIRRPRTVPEMHRAAQEVRTRPAV